MQNIEFWFSKLKIKLNTPICQPHVRVTLLLSASSKALLRKINSEHVELPRAHPKKLLTRPGVGKLQLLIPLRMLLHEVDCSVCLIIIVIIIII
jgi:hypothetical protein